MTGQDEASCRATLLTPAGRGAIATVAVTGRDALQVVEPFVRARSGQRLSSFSASSIVVGSWRSATGAEEEIVVVPWNGARVEIHCHGGSAASRAILQELASAGVPSQDPRAWLAEQVSDPIQRETWEALADARTERVAGILLDQWRGALRRDGFALRALLQQSGTRNAAAAKLERLLRWGELGQHLTAGWRVVLVGRPNVGKSSLVNALLGFERSIVFDQPGTTRDLLTATTAMDGWPIELIDTAGSREDPDPLELEGSRRALREVERADLVVIVVDAREPSRDLISMLERAARRSLVIASKTDQYPSRTALPAEWLPTCAVRGEGLEALRAAITAQLVPETPAPGAGVPFTARQIECLRQVRRGLDAGDTAAGLAALTRLLGE